MGLRIKSLRISASRIRYLNIPQDLIKQDEKLSAKKERVIQAGIWDSGSQRVSVNGRDKEIRRNIQSGEYRTTLAPNFNTITEAREILRDFPGMGNISVNYDDFTILKNRVLFTVKPRPIDKNDLTVESESEAPLE